MSDYVSPSCLKVVLCLIMCPPHLYEMFFFQAYVVSQTKIIYHDKELYQLVYQHLVSKGEVPSAFVMI